MVRAELCEERRNQIDADGAAGTTSVTVLAAEILREAEKLVTLKHVHPQTCVSYFAIV